MRTSFRAFGALLLASCLTSLAQGETGIRWQTDLAAARQLAASSNRLVLMHFSASWCHWCKPLETQVFNKDAVARAIEANFVPVKLDLDQHRALARQYGVTGVPWDVVIMPDGQVLKDFNSPQGAQAYVASMTEIAAKYRPQSPTMVAAIAAPPQATAVPANYAAQQPAPQQYAAQQPAAPQQGRYADNRYADYYKGRQQPVADPISPPIANQATGPNTQFGSPAAPPAGPSFNSPTGVNPQASMPPAYQVPALNAPQNAAPPQSSPVDARYGAPSGYSSIPQSSPAAPGNANYGAPVQQGPSHGFQPATPSQDAGSPQAYGLDGYCAIHLMEKGEWTKGNEQFGAIHRGKTYLFGGKQCQEKFLANPDRYSPAFDGNDPVLLIDRQQAVPGRRDIGCYLGVEPNRRIVLFADETSYQTFVGNPQRYAAQAFAPQQ